MAIDRGIVDRQLQALGESLRWWNLRELRDLPSILQPDERILAVARGKLGRLRFVRRGWLFVVTDSRLLLVRSAPAVGWRQIEVSAANITRVAMRVGPFRARVRVSTASRTYRLLVPRPDAYRLVEALHTIARPDAVIAGGFGPARIARRVIDHMLALPTAALEPAAEVERKRLIAAPQRSEAEERVEVLEDQIRELTDQVEFLQELLKKRQSESLIS